MKDLFDLKFPEGKQSSMKYFDHKFIVITVGITTLILINSIFTQNLVILTLFFGILGITDFFIDTYTDID